MPFGEFWRRQRAEGVKKVRRPAQTRQRSDATRQARDRAAV